MQKIPTDMTRFIRLY